MGEQATPVKRSSRLAEQKENVPPTPQDHPVASTEAEQDAVFNNVLNNSGASNQPPQTPQQPQEFENMGYDQNSTTQMANLGYDQGAPTPYRDDDYYNPHSVERLKAAEDEHMQEDEH